MTQQVRRAKKFVQGRRLLTAAIIACVAVAAGVGGTIYATAAVSGPDPDTCGYHPGAAPNPYFGVSGASSSGLATITFDENSVTRAIAFYGIGLSGHLGVFTNDESGLLIGAGGSASTGGTAPGSLGQLANPPALSTGTNNTSLTLKAALTKAVTSGDSIVVTGVVSGTTRTITFVASATVSSGTTIPIVGKKSNFVYPDGSTVNDPTVGKAGQAAPPPANLVGSGNDLVDRFVAPTIFLTDITGLSAGTVNTGGTSAYQSGDYERKGRSGAANVNGSGPYADAILGSWSPNVGTKPVNSNGWILGANADAIPSTDAFGGTTTSFNEGYGSEVKWNATQSGGTFLQAWVPTNSTGSTGSYQSLQTGRIYRVQSITHDTDQNKTSGGGDTGEVCTTFTVPGPPVIHTDPTGGTDIGQVTAHAHIKQWFGSSIKDTAFLPATPGFGNVTGTVTFNLYFDAGNAPNPAGSCVNPTDAPPGTLVHTFSNVALDGNDPSVATSGTYDTTGDGYGTYYWQDVFTPGGSNASSYTTVTEACGTQTDQMVNGRVRITPHSATNVIGATHTLHAMVETSTNGTAWTYQGSEPITSSLGPAGTDASYNGASATATPPGSCTTATGQTAVDDGLGNSPATTTTVYCNITITKSTIGTVFISASSVITLTGVSGGPAADGTITRSTNNGANCEPDDVSGVTDGILCKAVKHFINPKTNLIVSDQLRGLGLDATGTVTYTAWIDDNTCGSTDPAVKIPLGSTSTIVNGVANASPLTITVEPGHTVYFEAHYVGNEGDRTTTCTSESATSGS
jgi:hypothetical protein